MMLQQISLLLGQEQQQYLILCCWCIFGQLQ
jgi:hypothetical protein